MRKNSPAYRRGRFRINDKAKQFPDSVRLSTNAQAIDETPIPVSANFSQDVLQRLARTTFATDEADETRIIFEGHDASEVGMTSSAQERL